MFTQAMSVDHLLGTTTTIRDSLTSTVIKGGDAT
jgi:hypothetical protein